MSLDFFILGNPRSGTTLFRLMLNAHPLVTVPPECGFALWLSEAFGDWSLASSEQEEQVDTVVDAVLGTRKFETWGVQKEALRKGILTQRPATWSALVRVVYQVYADRVSATPHLLGDKNNYYISHIESLRRLAPQARFLHIVRDGRDVACSYLEVTRSNITSKYSPRLPATIREIAFEWHRNVTGVLEVLPQDASDRVHHLRYEDLVRFPEASLVRVCAFLGIPFDKGMLDYFERERTSEHASEPTEFLQWKSRVVDPPTMDSVGRYIRDLSPSERQEFEEVAGSTLTAFGYPVTP